MHMPKEGGWGNCQQSGQIGETNSPVCVFDFAALHGTELGGCRNVNVCSP